MGVFLHIKNTTIELINPYISVAHGNVEYVGIKHSEFDNLLDEYDLTIHKGILSYNSKEIFEVEGADSMFVYICPSLCTIKLQIDD